MARAYQEFYCASSGGGCGGYLTFPLNMAINGVVEVICPKCAHRHQRKIKNGILTDDGRYSSKATQEVTPTLAAWHKKAKHPDSKKRAGTGKEREAVVIDRDSGKRQADEAASRAFLDDRKFEIHGSKI